MPGRDSAAVLTAVLVALGGEGGSVSAVDVAVSGAEVVLAGNAGLDDSELLQLAASSRNANEKAKI